MKTILDFRPVTALFQNIVKVIDEDLNLDEEGKDLILVVLGLAWLQGANLALLWPQAVSEVLVGSREQRDMVSDTMENIIMDHPGRSPEKISAKELRKRVRVMMEQEKVAPFSRISLTTGYIDTLIN